MARRHPWWLAAAVLTGMLAGGTVAARQRRGRAMQQGILRPLGRAWTTVDGCRIHARVAPRPGTTPVVLVHGLGVSGAYFRPTAERLAVEYAVYVPDLPGHGLSDTPDQALDVPALGAALLDWLAAMEIPRAVLVGHSLGCQTVVEAALHEPARVARLVLVGLVPDPAARDAVSLLRRFVLAAAFEHPALVPLVARDYLRMNRRFLPEYRAMLDNPIEDKLARLAQPTMLVRGEHDALIPPEWFETAAALCGAGHTAVIPHWGHAVNYSAPGPLLRVIRPFLRETPA